VRLLLTVTTFDETANDAAVRQYCIFFGSWWLRRSGAVARILRCRSVSGTRVDHGAGVAVMCKR